MGNRYVIAAFDLLLDEISEIVNDINNQGAQFFTEGKYQEARLLITRVETIKDIQNKIDNIL